MRKVYQYWTSDKGDGYSEAVITYSFDSIDDDGKEIYGEERKTLKAAINDAKKAFKKHKDAYFSIYAHAELTDYYNDGTICFGTETDCARIGSLTPDGEYFDLCEGRDWLD